MRVNAVVAATLLSLIIHGAVLAAGKDIEFSDDFSQSQFEDLSRQFGMVISYTPLAPAEPLGILGFDVGLEVTLVDIDHNKSFWSDAIDGSAPDYLVFPKLHVQKGLPLGFDAGLVYAREPGTNIGVLGGELKWAFVKGGIVFPAMAVRGTYTQLIGIDQLDLSTYGVDLSISKGFTFVTPYAGIGQIWIKSKERADPIDLDTENLTLTKGFIGVKVTLMVFSFVAEVDFGEIPLYSLRGNLSF